jgi:hypothetical protein
MQDKLEPKEPAQTQSDEARREFLANAGKVAVAAPAAALLFAASSIPNKANAQLTSGGTPAGGGEAALVTFVAAAAAWHKFRG